jgi:hypothetical protein
METIRKGDYERLTKCMYNLETLLEHMGVNELIISKGNRNFQIQTESENLDLELLNKFCNTIDELHVKTFKH